MNQKAKNICKKVFKAKNINVALIVIVLFSSIYYLAGVNDLTVKGFRLRELKHEKQLAQEENMGYNIERTSLESYSNLSEKAEELKMVVADEIEYVTISSGLAKK